MLYRLLSYVLLAVFLVTFLFPLYWLLVLAVTPPRAAVEMAILPKTVRPVDFLVLLDVSGMTSFPLYVATSVAIALATTAIVLPLSGFTLTLAIFVLSAFDAGFPTAWRTPSASGVQPGSTRWSGSWSRSRGPAWRPLACSRSSRCKTSSSAPS